MKIKFFSNRFLPLLLCIVLVSICFFDSTVHASDGKGNISESSTDEAILSTLNAKKDMILQFLLSNVGIIAGTGIDISDLVISSDDIEIKRRSGSGDSSAGSSSGGGNDATERPSGGYDITFKRPFVNKLIKTIQEQTKDTDNGGYELLKTVPVNKVSALYFHNSVDYRSMYDLLKANGGLMGLYYSGQNAYFYKIDSSYYYVKSDTNVGINGVSYPRVNAYKNINYGAITFVPYYLRSVNTAVTSWDDTEHLSNATSSTFRKNCFMLYDYYSAFTSVGGGKNPLVYEAFIISSTGVSIPVFNTIDDLIAYTVKNNLYYTTSDFTGEGQEVTIDYDELDKILSGYYSGMYDMLQRLIEQNGGNALTPEQVQALADQVAESFDMLKAEINKGFEEQDALIQANSNILKAIKSVIEKGFENIKKLLEDISKKLENLKVDTGGIGGGLIVGGVDLLFDLAEFVKDFVVDTEKGVATLATGFADIVELMSQKFPFSIPWDIAFFVSSFADTPAPPVFELPIRLPRYGIDEKLVIDFSRFEVISKISRSMLTVIYAMGLLKFTDKIISNKKGGAV